MTTRDGEPRSPRRRGRRVRIPHPHIPQLTLKQVRVLRLFALLLVFSILVLYGVFRSARFQELLRRRCELYLTAKLARPVTIGGFDLSLVPPAFLVKDVSLANDPRGAPGPCFAAAEIELRGLPTILGRHLDVPRFRIVSPTLDFEAFEDGTNNFSGLLPPKKETGEEGLIVHLREAVVQRMTLRFRDWSAKIDVQLQGAAFTARPEGASSATHLALGAQRLQLRIGEYETLEGNLGLAAELTPGRLRVERIRLRGPRLSLDAFGGIDNLRRPVLQLFPTVETQGEELDKLFGIGLPLTGPLRVRGSFVVGEKGAFRARAAFGVAGRFGPFPMTASGLLHVDPGGVLAHVTRADYGGGELEASVRVERLKHPPLPVKLVVSGRGVGFESFFADLGLPGTGMLGRTDIDATLAWGRGGIERANGAASLRVTADPAARSAVSGRNPLPTSGGAPFLIRDGRFLFNQLPLNTAGGLQARLDGTIAFGTWTPDLTLRAETRDLKELERVAANWYAAIQGEPLDPPLRLAGSGGIEAHLTRAFGDPRIEGRLDASEFVLRDARFGEASGDFTVDRRVATFAPFAARDGAGSLSVTGSLAWGGPLGSHYRLQDLVVDLQAFPVERVLKFLDMDLPLAGPITGRLPLAGVTPAVTGSAPVVWEKAVAWGQGADRLQGTLAFEGDRVRVSGARAALGTGTATGDGFYRYADGAFEATLDVSGVSPGDVKALAVLPGLTGAVKASLRGSGTVATPELALDGTLENPAFEGSPVGQPGRSVVFSARTAGGGWSGRVEVPDVATLRAESPPRAPSRTDLTLEVARFAPFGPLLGLPPEAKLDGKMSASASLRQPAGAGSWEGEGSVSLFSATLKDRNISLSRPLAFRVEGGKLVLGTAELVETSGSGGGRPAAPSTATLTGSVGLEAPHALDLAATANLDAALLTPFLSGASASGRILLDARAAGTSSRPALTGRAVLESVDYHPAGGGTALEGITGTLLVTGGRLTTRDLTLHYSGGTVDVSASASLEGRSLTGVRAALHLTGIRAQPFSGFRATLSGDVRIEGERALSSARGEVVVDRAIYDANVGVDLAAILAGKRSAVSAPAPGAFDAVTLDVRLVVPPGAIQIRNNVARVDLSGDLLLRGNVGRPVLYGQLEAEEGARLRLKDQNYDLLSAKIIFSNPTRIEPFFDVAARTTVRTGQGDYRVDVGVTGTPSRLAARFSSDPQLTEAQIVSLLASGALPPTATPGAPASGTASTDASVTEAARDLLASLATEALTSRTKQFFRLDRFQIDPNFAGSSFTGPRVTVGKTVGRNFTATIAYQFGSSNNAQQQVIMLEYQLSPNAFLLAVQDEYGVYSLELKLRQQLR